MPMPMPPQGFPAPGQRPTPEQIQAMRRQLEADAQKAGMSVPEFVAKLRQQAMQRAQQQGMPMHPGQAGPPGPPGQPGQPVPVPPGQPGPMHHQHPHPHSHPHQHGPARPVGPPGAQPVVPGPPNPKALAIANFLRSQELKPRTCILNGERKDMFRGTSLFSSLDQTDSFVRWLTWGLLSSQTCSARPPVPRLRKGPQEEPAPARNHRPRLAREYFQAASHVHARAACVQGRPSCGPRS